MSVIRCAQVCLASISLLAPMHVPASAQEDAMVWVIVEVEDLRPRNEQDRTDSFGAVVAYAMHDGTFQAYREGEQASEALRTFANEGYFGPLQEAIIAQDQDVRSAYIMPPDLSARGSIQWSNAIWDGLMPMFDRFSNRYFSYFIKICPSDDAFIANEDSRAIEVFDDEGRFLGPIVFDIYSEQIMDAGTRANDEANLACLDRYPHLDFVDVGERTHEPIRRHPGFNGSVGNPHPVPVRILGGENTIYDWSDPDQNRPRHVYYDPVLTDFTRAREPILRIRITSGMHGAFSGTYYDPARQGEGFSFEVAGEWLDRRLVMTWYTYRPDGSGEPMFLIGEGPLAFLNGAPNVELYEATGGRFASTDNPELVTVRRWGSVRVEFPPPLCQRARIFNIQPENPAYEVPSSIMTQRVTPLLSGFERYCGTYLVPVGSMVDF
jgi:hypothetical protein